MDDLDGIGPEEGFLHEVSQPLRWRDEDKLPQTCEQLLLARKVLTAVVYPIRLRVGTELRTVMAATLPKLAAYKIKMSTMTGEGPTVVQGPDDGPVVLFQEVEEYRIVQVVAVDVVQVDDVRCIRLDLRHKTLRRGLGEQALTIGQARAKGMIVNIEI